MISNLFINACILITFISVGYILFKDKDIRYSSSIRVQILVGFVNGIVGIILMFHATKVSSNLILDFRYIPMLISAIYEGYIPVMISSVIISICRLLYFGVTKTSVLTMILIIIIADGFAFICNCKLSRKTKWFFCLGFLFISYFLSIFVLNWIPSEVYMDLSTFYLGTIVVSFIVYFYQEFLIEAVRYNEKMKMEATKDFLTGLNNRRYFESLFNDVLNRVQAKGEKVSLLIIDVDFFKRINDTYGHSTGDLILKGLAQIFLNSVGKSDIVSRNGGEEFSVILPDASIDRAIDLAENLRRNVESNTFVISDELNLKITISIGISTYPDNTQDVFKIYQNADEALYEAKRSGRNKVISYCSELKNII